MKNLINKQLKFNWWNDSKYIDKNLLSIKEQRKQNKMNYLNKHIFNKQNKLHDYMRTNGIID